MRRPSRVRRTRAEAEQFRLALLRLRNAMKWSQERLGLVLGISKRTVGNWENGYWLPPFNQRVHIVAALHKVPPEHVLEIADGLGVSVSPGAAPLLKAHREALADFNAEPEPPLPPPPRPRPSPEAVRSAIDVIVRDAADGMNVLANDLRATLGRALAACAELGGTLADAQAAVVVKAKPAKGGTSA
jgi:transcriptional regulator with XRE-family HTH domain